MLFFFSLDGNDIQIINVFIQLKLSRFWLQTGKKKIPRSYINLWRVKRIINFFWNSCIWFLNAKLKICLKLKLLIFCNAYVVLCKLYALYFCTEINQIFSNAVKIKETFFIVSLKKLISFLIINMYEYIREKQQNYLHYCY